MQLGMIGLGRMGSNMVKRLQTGGHHCVVFDHSPGLAEALRETGAIDTPSLEVLVERLPRPRAIWMMVPAAVVDSLIGDLVKILDEGDILIDGGNSHFKTDIARAESLCQRGIHYVDIGTSGGVHGLQRGYCLMIGGEPDVVEQLRPVFQTLAPGFSEPRTAGNEGEPSPAEQGWLHCGPAGAGHFVKMVHNGIEYGMMQALAEGFNLLNAANSGSRGRSPDAETAPLMHPEHYQYDFDVAEIAELWRRGSVVSSWLLDLVAHALLVNGDLDEFSGEVADSGEGRWTVLSAVETGVPTPTLSAALFARFSSREAGDFANRLLSAMRAEFGGHVETPDQRRRS